MPEISHQQAEALRALEWLLTEDEGARATGRSQIMALAYLRFALNRMRGVHWGSRPSYMGSSWVRVVDHMHTTYMGTMTNSARIVLGYVEDIATEAGLAVEIRPSPQARFRITGLRQGVVDPTAPWSYIFEQFVETDIQRGFGPETARRRAVNGPYRAATTPNDQEDPEGPEEPDEVERGIVVGLDLRDRIANNRQLFRTTRVGRGATLRENLISHVREHPGQTATQIARVLGRQSASVASTLLNLTHEGLLERQQGGGPRGGWTYYVPVEVRGPSVWERVRVNPFKET